MRIAYGIVIETEKDRVEIGVLHSDRQVDELDVACDLVATDDSDILKLQPSDIQNMVIALAYDGELEIHDLDPELIWALIPAAKIIAKNASKGGDKN